MGHLRQLPANPATGAERLDRAFFLDDEDLKLVRRHRGDRMRAGFALHLVTVRWLGRFLEDPLDVPGVVLEFTAGEQLGLAGLAAPGSVPVHDRGG